MSASVLVICLDCRVAAPPIGDYGFIGWPSMIDVPQEPSGEAWEWATFLPFGCIRKSFAEVGISTDELEQVAEFMSRHNGHRFGLSSDGELQDEVEGIEDGQAIAEEIEESGVPTPLSYTDRAERATGPFVLGRYTLTCTCGATYATPDPEVLRPLPDVPWTPVLLEAFRKGILDIDSCNFWRVTSALLDPCGENSVEVSPLRHIAAFVTEHLEHGVTARVLAAKQAP